MAHTLESYALHYSSLPDEDLERLSGDVQSLMPDARMALKAEMERRIFQPKVSIGRRSRP